VALPIWLWLVIIIAIFVVAGILWLRKVLVTDPASRRAAASGQAITDPKLEGHSRSAVLRHEVTAPGPTSFVAFLSPLQFARAGVHVRTPISVALSERTMCIAYKQGALGNVAMFLVDRSDITSGSEGDAPGGLSYTIETSRPDTLRFTFQSEEHRQQLASWATANLTDHR
jgi:hypothetical protein